MASETIVAVFRTAAEAEAVAVDLRKAGISPNSIEQHSQAYGKTGADATMAEPASGKAHSGLWAWLLGEESHQDQHTMYDDAMAGGGVVLSVIVTDADAAKVEALIDQHHPVQVDERAATGQPSMAQPGMAPGAMPAPRAAVPASTPASMKSATPTSATAGATDKEQVIPLAEERMEVGKRSVDQGSARVRRYVVERPVEEQIRLRTESLRVERRPVTGNGAVAQDAFSEKIVEVRQMGEEAVVGKTARVVEEVVVGKQVGERVETVRDTVRKEEVEIADSRGGQAVAPKAPASATPASAKPAPAVPVAARN